ncbi:MAG: hypothetical protein INR69_19255 [Mucilaginibacter polytrichastri]|nr:hypothetical protein [Mucilaginibacter polytrichastri]
MGKKLALNTLYTLGIFLSFLAGLWCYEHQKYPLIAGAVFIAVTCVILKARLLKQIRETQRKQGPKTSGKS